MGRALTLLPSNYAPVLRCCYDCDQRFTVTSVQVAWLATRGQPLPLRCAACLGERQTVEAVEATDQAIQIDCRDCGRAFTFGTRDQEWFCLHGWPAPKRCKPCRVARRAAENVQV
jgi:hypothetical protein